MVLAADPFALPDPVVLLLIILVGLVATPTLFVYAFKTMARHGIRKSGSAVTLRYLAAFAAGAALAVYAWGALGLLMDETAAAQACKDAVGPARAGSVDRYEFALVPLRFGCHVAGDGTYEAVIAGYVNPTVLGLVLLAVVLAVFAAFESADRNVSDNSPTEKNEGKQTR
ncbi:hypothetical protein ACWGR4_35590 [Embleya sp. NPDC055664]